MEDFSKNIGKYVLTILLLAAGLVFLMIYTSSSGLEKQPQEMMIAALFMIIAGVLALPQVASKMNKIIKLAIFVLTLGATAYLGYAVFNSIDSEIEFIADKKQYDDKVIQNLKDLREAEVAYRKVNGKYTKDFNKLKGFINDKVIPIPQNWGVFHDSIEGGFEEYNTLGYVLKRHQLDSVARDLGVNRSKFVDMINNDQTFYKVRDTSYVSFWEEHFTPEMRADKELPNIDLAMLNKNPKGKDFIIKTSMIDNGGVKVPTIEVVDPDPFGRDGVKKVALKFGDINNAHTDGNWKREE